MHEKITKYRIELAIGLLGFLLVLQYMHSSRDTLATNRIFASTIAPIYRVFGAQITPRWDIAAWQFTRTSGEIDSRETALTISSSIVSRSNESLPYPLILVSLTNRFEDIIGRRLVKPAEYLYNNVDPKKFITTGRPFTATIAIQNPSTETTGFKLNVCYETRGGTARCNIENFKN